MREGEVGTICTICQQYEDLLAFIREHGGPEQLIVFIENQYEEHVNSLVA
jgi:hypothetical protein